MSGKGFKLKTGQQVRLPIEQQRPGATTVRPRLAEEPGQSPPAVGVRAKCRPVTDSAGMNKTERSYAKRLELRRIAGEILSWRFEPAKWRLANMTTYAPDFMVIAPDGVIEFHEVKGFWREDARVKIKVFAEQFPEFRVVAATKAKAPKRKKGEPKQSVAWKTEVFNP